MEILRYFICRINISQVRLAAANVRCVLMILLIVAATCAAGGQPCLAEDRIPSEQSLKLAFLYNFSRFIQWPAESSPSTEFIIGIFGNAETGGTREDRKEGAGKKVVFRHIQRPEQARECHMVYIPAAEKSLLPQVLRQVETKPVVTVGDFDGFLRSGGMINLVSSKGRMTFDINVGATKKAGLTVGYQLLRLARELI